MDYSSTTTVLQSLRQASEADESTPNLIVADPQKEKHMNQSNKGQNNIFSEKERDSLYFIDSFSDKKNYESTPLRSPKFRDHHRQRVQARRLSPSPDFRSVHAKRITMKRKIDSDLASTYSSGDNCDYHLKRGVRKSSSSPNSSVRRSMHSRRIEKKRKRDSDLTSTSSIEGIYSIYRQRNSFKKSRKSRDHHRQRSESSYQQFPRQSTVNARFRGGTRRDSSVSSLEYKDTSRSATHQVRRRDSSGSSLEFNDASRTARFRGRQSRDHHRQRSESS